MNKYLSLFLLLLASTCLSAQVTLEREVIGSLGQSFANGDLQVSSTVGEAAVTTLSNEAWLLTQGFHQAEREDLTSVQIVPEIISDLAVYPNPTNGQFWVRVVTPAAQSLRFEVMDVSGRILSSVARRLPAETEARVSFNATDWPAGLYLIRLLGDNGTLAGSARLVIVGN
ncbi:T9SS type A sorting domain-containing protein [Neolewinella persica]|uniref:T9SS type A sorting domain-containing protein n=1 Tax=Neolewinella persica TaxID=70998 RepID=UPI00036D98B9|nr:T9SS type A sorting domain-containing protein [Neolewinella persica]